jgi:hypothetical protein
VQSALVSARPTRELIIVDDGSVDGTASIIESEGRRDPRIVALRQPRLGLVAALELARRHARAPLIARLDADDLAYPERFVRQVEVFFRRPELALLGAAVDKIDEAGQPIGRIGYPTDSWALKRELWARNPFVHSTVMFRADRADEVGGYRNHFEAAEDYDLWFRLSERWAVANLADRLGALRIHHGTITHRRRIRQALSAALVRRCAAARQRGHAEPLHAADRFGGEPAPLHIEEMELCFIRALEFADRTTLRRRLPDLRDVVALMSATTDNQEERKLAQHAMLNILSHGRLPEGTSRSSVAAAFVRTNPWRAIRLAGRMIRQNAGLAHA